MQSIEEFFREYLASRTALLRASVGPWDLHIHQFFAPDYEPWNRQKSVGDSEAETVLEVNDRDGSPVVITSGMAGRLFRLRYRLSARDGSWQITNSELECGICKGSGQSAKGSACRLCKGKGWSQIGFHRSSDTNTNSPEC